MSHIRLRLHASIRIHGALPHTPPKETFCKKSPLESRKTAFDFYYLLGFYLLNPKLSKGRRTCLIFAFGCTQVSGYMGLLPHTPPKETFCKKSPLESRKTIFDFYVWFFIVCSQGIKITIHAADFWWIVKLGWCFKAYTIPCAFFGVLRTYYRLWRFAKCLTALSEVNPQKPTFGCKQLSGWLLLSRYQKAGVHAAGFWWIILFEDTPKLSTLIFDGL